MGHHIDPEGRFQSVKHPTLPPDKIIVSFKDPRAWAALRELALGYINTDPGLSEDITERLRSIRSLNETGKGNG